LKRFLSQIRKIRSSNLCGWIDHWDTWNEGNLIMCFIKENKEGAIGIDILKGEADSPQNLWR
jgi:hypothetical protein